jgi:deazaflavin-dependent oxidoreductase (nitroreductase family)
MAKTWTQNKRFQRLVNAVFAKLHRLRKGKLAMGSMPSILLHTIGARSGAERMTPLMCLDVAADLGEGTVAIIASNGGADRAPGWYHNCVAHPSVRGEIGGEARRYTARVATAGERAEYWPRATAAYKGYAKYQARTDREIPMVILTPAP